MKELRIRMNWVATVLLMFAGSVMLRAARADELLRDNFAGTSLSANWEASANNVKISDGRMVFTNGPRSFVRSVKTDWAKQSFRAEITVTVDGDANGCGYFGMGEGQTGGDPYRNPNAVPAAYVLCGPSGFAEGPLDLRVNGATKWTLQPGPGSGTHRLRLTWDAHTHSMFVEVNRNWQGGEFKRDDLLVAQSVSANFTSDNAHLFFGGAGGAAFSDLVVTTVSPTDIEGFSADFFAEMAKQKLEAVPGMEGNSSPKLPDIALPWDAQLDAGFKGADKIDTQAELDAELQRMRERYTPFMTELAPALPATRRRMMLEKFDYHLVSAGDKPVDRAWEQVTIPHYTGPIDKAEAHYKTAFELDSDMLAQDALFLHFQAVDYIAEVYVNGQPVGRHEGLFGAFEYDIKPFVHAGANELLVKVYNDAVMMGDFFNTGAGRPFGKKLAACGGPGWDNPQMGWHMCPPGFGIWQKCWIESRSAPSIRDIFVRPMPQENQAEVWVETSGDTKGLVLSYSLYGQNFNATIAQDKPADATPSADEPNVTRWKFVVSVPAEQMRWWSLDEPWLYQLQVQLKREGKLIDAGKRSFGMRTFVQSADSTPKGRFYLNGKEIKLRGANMMGNLMRDVMRNDMNQLRDDILLAKIANMTFWRMTQQPCQEEVYDYFDKLGLLAQSDMPAFNGYRYDCVDTAHEQFAEMMRLVRGHPCNAVISYLNEPDFNKPVMLDRAGHTQLFRDFDAMAVQLNPDQVTKWVDGDYVSLSPRFSDIHDYSYWYGNGIRGIYFGGWHATRADWMCGCGEFGAEGLDSIALMNKYYPKEWLETKPDGTWTPSRIPRCQTPGTGMKWQSLTTRTMEDWVHSSREHQMWGTRLMTESLRRMPKMNSFAVHLLIDAWPAGWLKSIMDCDRQAKPAFFAYRDALTPLAVNLQPEQLYYFGGDMVRIRAWVLNDTTEVPPDAVLRYQLERDGEIIQTGHAPANITASDPTFQGNLEFAAPDADNRQSLTVRLALFDQGGNLLHDTSVDLDLFPASDKGKKLDHPGGPAQRLISQ
ncbi:MAG: hypothetical protein GC162_16195 [Planctomycetes bacterium]|nr:hypothetical protein [Planctomycetota bacterium]